jgi:hypothetical protein
MEKKHLDFLNNYKTTEIYYQEYYLIKDLYIYKISIRNIENEIIIRSKNFQLILNLEDLFSLTKIKFEKINKAYEYILNLFEENKVVLKDIIPNKELQLVLKINNEIEANLSLLYDKANDFIINEINKLNKAIDIKK